MASEPQNLLPQRLRARVRVGVWIKDKVQLFRVRVIKVRVRIGPRAGVRGRIDGLKK